MARATDTNPPATRPRLSIAMCTYNGAKHLGDQLESFLRQSRSPDELVICDDRSTDDTCGMVEAFATRSPFPVRLVRNETQLGVAANFGKAIGLCTGDWILLSDQDDIWLPHKLATIEAAIAAHPGVGLVFSDADVVDELGAPLGSTFCSIFRFTPDKQRVVQAGQAWKVFLRQFVAQGTAMAFDARLRDVILPIPVGLTNHDDWINMVLPAVARVHFIPEPLLLYRQHSRQLTGSRRVTMREHAAKSVHSGPSYQRMIAERYQAAMDRLRERGVPLLTEDMPALYAAKVRHNTARATIRESRWWALPLAVRELFTLRYFRYSSWRGAIGDLLFPGRS